MYLAHHAADQVWSDIDATEDALADASVERRIDATVDLLDQLLRQYDSADPLNKSTVVDLTLIVPVFNEVETLPQVLARIDEVMPVQTEVIIVDDGSTDGTAQWLRDHGAAPNRRIILRRKNHGKGSAVRLAIRHSRGRVVAIQDADLEYDPADLLGVVWPVLEGKSKAVYGSRYLRKTDKSLVHRSLNKMLTFLSNLTTGQSLTDMETCHKAFEGDLVRSLKLCERRFGLEPEITAKISARGVKIDEVPTRYEPRSYAEGKKITWRDGIAALACLWRYRRSS
jgi:glycosyltransferase involved in cell wall biosynthesis